LRAGKMLRLTANDAIPYHVDSLTLLPAILSLISSCCPFGRPLKYSSSSMPQQYSEHGQSMQHSGW